MAREQVASYRVDIRYKSGKEGSIQVRQVEWVAGEAAENAQTERRALANDPPRSTWAGFVERRRRLALDMVASP